MAWRAVVRSDEVPLSANRYGVTGDNATDDTAALQAALTAAAGKSLYIPPAPSMYRITAALSVGSGTTVILHRSAIIRQETNYTPVFDLLDTSDVTIEGGYFRYEGTRTYNNSTAVRNNGPIGMATAIWTNSPRTAIRNVRVYGFAGPAVMLAGYNTSISDHQSYYLKDCVVENLLVDTVSWGVLAYGFDGLSLKNISGSPVNAPDGTQSTGGPHLIYITNGGGTNQNVLNRGLNLDSAYAHDIPAAAAGSTARAYQFKGVRGATIGRLQAYNCPGIVTFQDSKDIYISGIVSTNDLGDYSFDNGSFSFSDTICTRIRVDSVDIDMGAQFIPLKFNGSHIEIRALSVNGFRNTSAGNLEVWLQGTNNVLGAYRYRNKGSAGERALYIAGTDNTARNLDITGVQIGVHIDAAAVRPVVEYDPRMITVNSLSAGTPPVLDNGSTNPLVRTRYTRGSFSTTGGAAVNTVYPSQVTHAVVSVNATNAFTISDPNVPIVGMELTYEIFNNSGGAIGTITWGSGFELNSTFENPAAGARKTITFRYDGTKWRELSRGMPNNTILTLGSDVSNATTSYADITGLSFAVTSGVTYRFRALIIFTVNATTTGSAWSVNGPTSPTQLAYTVTAPNETNTAGYGATGLAPTILSFSTYNARTTASASTPATSGNLAEIRGIIQPSASGTFAIRFASEVAVTNGVVAKTGSSLEYS